MRWPRLRFSLRGMMIAVALSPIVFYAGQWAGMERVAVVSVISPPSMFAPVPTVPTGQVEDTDDLGPYEARGSATIRTMTVFEFSTGPALLAMAATTALLAAVWVLVARSIGRIKRA